MPNLEDLFKDFEARNLRIIARNAQKIRALYQGAIIEISLVGATIKLKEGVFKLSKYPALQKVVERELKKLHGSIYATLVNSIKESWDLANQKNNLFVDRRLAGRKPTRKGRQILYDPNRGALEQFLNRKEKGLNLSKRVWNTLEPFKTQLETGLAVGISEGKSAAEMAKQLKSFLNEPDQLFRRVRQIKGDPNSKLVLSKAAQEFHPGRGVYRSSYQNALRLTATETNIAYRSADHERWKNLAFVIGIEVKTSNNHPEYDQCDQLKGVYPKDFKFTGWHPKCLCFSVPKQMTDEQFDQYQEAILNGEQLPQVQGIGKMPESFMGYVKENKKRIEGWKSTPYWYSDNKHLLK
jgi:hypothetical protein